MKRKFQHPPYSYIYPLGNFKSPRSFIEASKHEVGKKSHSVYARIKHDISPQRKHIRYIPLHELGRRWKILSKASITQTNIESSLTLSYPEDAEVSPFLIAFSSLSNFSNLENESCLPPRAANVGRPLAAWGLPDTPGKKPEMEGLRFRIALMRKWQAGTNVLISFLFFSFASLHRKRRIV